MKQSSAVQFCGASFRPPDVASDAAQAPIALGRVTRASWRAGGTTRRGTGTRTRPGPRPGYQPAGLKTRGSLPSQFPPRREDGGTMPLMRKYVTRLP